MNHQPMPIAGPSRLASISSNTSASIAAPAKKSTTARASRATKAKPKAAASVKEEVEDEDDDTPVFLGSTIADLQKFRHSPSSSSSTSARVKKEVKPKKPHSTRSRSRTPKEELRDVKDLKDEKKVSVLPLLPPLPKQAAAPVPPWLGKSAVLLHVPKCPVCKSGFREKDSGAARWRHISTCLPPLYRPPNPPPDLPNLLREAFEELNGPRIPPSLMGHHLANSTELLEDRRREAGQQTTITGRSSPAKAKTNVPIALRKMTTVLPVEERAQDWDLDVDDRVADILHSSPASRRRASRSPSVKSPRDSVPTSPVISFPPTQPLGESSLAGAYSKNILLSPRVRRTTSRSPSPKSPRLMIDTASNVDENHRQGRRMMAPGRPFEEGEDHEPMLSSPKTPTRQPPRPRQKRASVLENGENAFEQKEAQRDSSDLTVLTPEKRPRSTSPTSPTQKGAWTYRSQPSNLSPTSPFGPADVASPSGRGFEGDEEVGERSMTASPGHPRLSITPRKHPRTRLSTSVTPLAGALSNTSITVPEEDEGDSDVPIYDVPEEDWGDDAVLQWNGGIDDDMGSSSDVGADSASSVAPGDAGLATEDEEEDEWGRDAFMDFDLDATRSQEATEAEESSSEEEEPVEYGSTRLASPQRASSRSSGESYADLRVRGMPDYESWDVKKLQKLSNGYGYRPSTSHTALVKIAVNCWRAINPPPPSALPLVPTSSGSSISSADMPLAKTKGRKVKSSPKAKGKSSPKGNKEPKGKGKEPSVPPVELPSDLNERFMSMIDNDRELYLRILRYEPISIDELIAKAIANGIKEVGWKDKLKKFLDEQGITHFSADLTGQRRRR